jgi:hypothetical protein
MPSSALAGLHRAFAAALLLAPSCVLIPNASAQTRRDRTRSKTDAPAAQNPTALQAFEWAAAPPMPTARAGLAAAGLDNRLYALGGRNSGGDLGTVEVFDPAANAWSPVAPTTFTRNGTAALVLDGKLYAVGGGSGDNFHNRMEVYDPASNTWAEATPMPTARGFLGAVALFNLVYAINGRGFNPFAGFGPLARVEVYDPVSNSWAQPPNSVSVFRERLAACALNNRAYVLGGSNLSGFLNSMEVLAQPTRPGDVIISEFRWSGPGADATARANNEFIELYNTTDSNIIVTPADGSAGWAVAADDETKTRYVIPSRTVIPARGHFLITNGNGYSLSNHPAGGDTTATPDATTSGPATYTGDIAANTGIALFRTSVPIHFNAATRIDSVGTAGGTNVCTGQANIPASSPLYREGAGLVFDPAESLGEFREYSYARKLNTSAPRDTNGNAADFTYVSTGGDVALCGGGIGGSLGAPGPENLSSPVNRGNRLKVTAVAPCVAPSASPNRERVPAPYPDLLSNTGTYAHGTLRIRRRFVNSTGGDVTRLRFRVVDITTLDSPGYAAGGPQADLRAISSGDEAVVINPCPGSPATSRGLTLEMPPAQPNGGGYNSTLSAGTVALATPLAAGNSVTVNFLLGVAQPGEFRFYFIVEALPAPRAAAAVQSSKVRSRTPAER